MGVDVGRMRRAECILAVLEVVGGLVDEVTLARLNEALAVAGGADELAELLAALYAFEQPHRALILTRLRRARVGVRAAVG